jgi:hypothetical protein
MKFSPLGPFDAAEIPGPSSWPGTFPVKKRNLAPCSSGAAKDTSSPGTSVKDLEKINSFGANSAIFALQFSLCAILIALTSC